MIIAFIVQSAVMLMVCWMGWLIWKKLRIDLIHSYHVKNVKDVPGYCRAMGKTLFGLGIFIGLTGMPPIINYIPKQALGPVVLAGIGIVFVIIYRIQRKYNGGMFS